MFVFLWDPFLPLSYWQLEYETCLLFLMGLDGQVYITVIWSEFRRGEAQNMSVLCEFLTKCPACPDQFIWIFVIVYKLT